MPQDHLVSLGPIPDDLDPVPVRIALPRSALHLC
jgi:hypothetical protein